MDIQRPVFNNPNELKNNENNEQNVENVKGRETKISAPKVATNFKIKLKYIILAVLIVVIVTTSLIFAFAGDDVEEITNISIKPVVSPIDYDLPENNFDTFFEDGEEKFIIMPGDSFKGKVTLTSKIDENHPELAGGVFVRYRIEPYVIIKQNGKEIKNYIGNIVNTTKVDDDNNDWFDDNKYFYYNDILKPEQSISTTIKITLNTDLSPNYLQSKSLCIECTFEVLQASQYQSINEIWVSAPYVWKNAIIKKANDAS